MDSPDPSGRDAVQPSAGAHGREVTDSLREAEEQFEKLVAGVRDYAIFVLDPEGRVASWNAGARALKGWEAHEIMGSHVSCFYPPEVAASGWPHRELAIAATRGRFEDEGWRMRKDGTQFWANVVITALHTDAGELRGFLKITRDLTERRRAEESLRAGRDELDERVRLRTAELAGAN